LGLNSSYDRTTGEEVPFEENLNGENTIHRFEKLKSATVESQEVNEELLAQDRALEE
jgi:hypothetical protein